MLSTQTHLAKKNRQLHRVPSCYKIKLWLTLSISKLSSFEKVHTRGQQSLMKRRYWMAERQFKVQKTLRGRRSQLKYTKEWAIISWINKSWIFEPLKLCFIFRQHQQEQSEKMLRKKVKRNERPFWDPARGRRVNIYSLTFSSFKFAVLHSKSLFSFLLWNESFHSKLAQRCCSSYWKQNRKTGLSWLCSELMQSTVTHMLLLQHWPLTYLTGFLACGRTRPGVTV